MKFTRIELALTFKTCMLLFFGGTDTFFNSLQVWISKSIQLSNFNFVCETDVGKYLKGTYPLGPGCKYLLVFDDLLFRNCFNTH